MSKRMMVLLVALLASASAAAQSGSTVTGTQDDRSVAELELDKVIASIPIHRVPTTPEIRRKQQSKGERVLLVEGRPGYLYRDFLQASVRSGPANMAQSPILRTPQENPDVYGCVTVSFEIRPDGKTDGFEVVKSEPAGVFDKQALRAVFSTEYEPVAEGSARPRHERSIWFLVARPPRSEFSKANKAIEDSRNRRREELREACEGPAT